MAAYRSSATIAEALDSALAQTLPAREIVVGYRHSDDDPVEEALTAFGDRIVVLRVDEGGPTAALNAAIDASTGDFVANVDADDRLLPGYLEALAALGARYPSLDMLASDLWLEEEGERVGRGASSTATTGSSSSACC